MTDYSYAQLEELWDEAGGPADEASTAAAIGEAESGGNPLAAYPGTTVAPGQGSTTDATGLWQILGLPAGNFTAAELTDPVWNARMAVAKYEQAGDSFSPWQTYDSGAYLQFLQGGVAPSSSGVPSSPSNAVATSAASPSPLTEAEGGFLGSLFGVSPSAALSNPLAGVNAFANDIETYIKWQSWLFNPANWVRIGAFICGLLALVGSGWMIKEAL